jgi:two-component system chemotaxis response regulator CheB
MVPENKFFMAAVGVSAGGLEPLHEFFSQIPSDSGIAFIVIPHLNRDYVSIADKLLARHTTMPVWWASQGQKVKPNHIYILPINKMMTIEKGYLQLRDRPVQDRSNWAVDIFFKSLAKVQKAYAIGIVLSGAGSDGTLGAIAIHNEQGMVLVQDPQTAEFTSMPQSAILKDHPAQILSPERLAQALLTFVTELP